MLRRSHRRGPVTVESRHLAYDRDAAGRKAAHRLLQISPRFKVLPLPQGNDITDFFLSGGDLYAWIAEALAAVEHQERV